jgi:hypothetical protein
MSLGGDPLGPPAEIIPIPRIGMEIENAREYIRELLPHDLERLPEAINNLIQVNIELHYLQSHQESDADKKLVQTVISEELYAWLEATADSEGISTAAYVRKLIITAKGESDRIALLEERISKLEAQKTKSK